MRMKLFWSLLVSAACLCSASNLAAKSDAVDNGYYTTKDSEFYLTPEQLLFIRPGLIMEIQSVVIPADRKTEVTFKLSDPAGLPLDRTGIYTPGPVSTSFILAYIPNGEDAYVAYTSRVQTSPITGDSFDQASTDSGGSYTEVGDGTYMYKFGTAAPADYDMDATHTLGVYASRNLSEFELSTYYANELEHFVPSGMYDPKPREIVTTETCNGRCHDPIALHGGSRREVGLCILCHNPSQGIDPDTGNSVDMPLMIHKIHMGAQLTNGYNVIGYRQTNHDYSDVVYPAEINECETCHTGGTPTADFPLVASPSAVPVCDMSGLGKTKLNWGDLDAFEIHMGSASGTLFAAGSGEGSANTGKWVADGTRFVLVDKASGDTVQELTINTTVLGCVANAPGTFRGVAATDHTNWLVKPNRKNCGSCHDYVNFATGAGHSDFGLIQKNDDQCNLCHKPSAEEFGWSIKGAHTALYKSVQLPGFLVDILSVTDTDPGDTPTVTFSLSNKYGSISPAGLAFFNLIIAGPNDDFDFLASERATGATQVGDNYSYTFNTPLPADATGSFTAGAEIFNMTQVDLGNGPTAVRETAENPTFAFAVTDAVAVPRRMVVDDYKCESCHSNLALHGTIRHDPQYCVTCHQPLATDLVAVRPGNMEQTINFKYMVHSIHRGAELQNGFVVAGFNQSIHDYSDIEYPGDLRNCDACHVNHSEEIPLTSGLLPTMTPQALVGEMQPESAACLSCHDSDSAVVHAATNTVFFGESCSVCHGEGRIAAIDKVHAH